MCLAVPGKIESIEGTDPIFRSGKVNFGGILKNINLAYVPDAKVGDYVLVHVGFAIARIDENAAREALDALNSIDEIERQRRERGVP